MERGNSSEAGNSLVFVGRRPHAGGRRSIVVSPRGVSIRSRVVDKIKWAGGNQCATKLVEWKSDCRSFMNLGCQHARAAPSAPPREAGAVRDFSAPAMPSSPEP